MNIECNLADGKKLMVEILKYIDKICEREKLKYFIIYGTLLGAVRHKGFIPWDDDIDIIMPKKDQERLIEIILRENDGRFSVQDKTLDANYPLEFTKIIMNGTECILNKQLKSISETRGVFIDIFTLEVFRSEISQKHRKYIRLFENARKKVLINNLKSEKVKILLKSFRVVSNILIPFNLIDVYRRKYVCDDGEFIGSNLNQDSTFFSRKEYVYPLRKIQFEDIEVWAPNNVDKVLEGIYGDTYMELPPEGKRHTHLSSIMVSEEIAKRYEIGNY